VPLQLRRASSRTNLEGDGRLRDEQESKLKLEGADGMLAVSRGNSLLSTLIIHLKSFSGGTDGQFYDFLASNVTDARSSKDAATRLYAKKIVA
jgi:hypothetical protein